ncbi:hypothetical protein LTR28_011639, partial [Elasticomyces elasticus]
SLKRSLDSGVPENIVFERKLAFDEVMVLKEMVPGLRQTLQKCVSVELVKVDEGGKTGVVVGGTSQEDQGRERTELPPPAENAVPGGPTFHFDNV